MGRTIDRVDELFKEFLYVSKPESGEPEAFDLKGCVHDCLDLLAPRFERLGVKVAVELPEPPAMVRGYPVSLKRALINVLTNAEQVSPQGGTVCVKLTRDGESGVVEIADEGPGIPRADRHRVFDMFVSSRPGGTGLGLSLAKTAVESCGGTIRAEDRPGGGTRMMIRIPLCGRGANGAGALSAPHVRG